MKKVMLSTVLGALMLFIWSGISWMVLDWHNQTIHNFTNDQAVASAIQANAPQSGIYFMPNMMHPEATANTEPQVFAAVKLEGMSNSMVKPLVYEFVLQLVLVLLVSSLLMQTANLNYVRRYLFILTFAIATALWANVPYYSWFGFDSEYTLVMMADALIGWALAGLVIAGIIRGHA